jgi:chemotaxis protein methyltransferase CheR
MNQSVEDIEIQVLLDAICLRYGYDFRDYSRAHVKRRLAYKLSISKCNNFSELQHKILIEPEFFQTILASLSVNVTEMFRDPTFYSYLRSDIIPYLKTFTNIKIWHAGCSTGEEVYSMAILLKEEGLYDRIQIYATDFNETVLNKAKEGIFDLRLIREYTSNYQKAGGIHDFSNYYTAKYDFAVITQALKKNITFAQHNLVTDGIFGAMNIIICRNVLIYFNRGLQSKVVGLFKDSLIGGGFLCLGSKESIRFSEHAQDFEVVDAKEKIYKKKGYC